MLALAEQQRLPLLLLAEGGGGRPGDVDIDPIYNSQLAVSTFRQMGRLSGRVPLVGVASGGAGGAWGWGRGCRRVEDEARRAEAEAVRVALVRPRFWISFQAVQSVRCGRRSALF
mmetsp:Transcript_2450/g.8033  ORF Transcript_2450/g.8033 Transcript_2450/m.8033 type:complete len:115 (+) Transcript_2450:601-945(+)